ncbi:MAG: hypothetical protein C7B45_11660 [Sulfobacillus acidophilus]|uniref:Uncharacterized protein n=1 Tax=Sulfobacillus acidophilus TaxID=53633 RepID=A0A2T2WGA4_9FIRM|nr:MAG: hypothetical protein C7B45_11660 [Sulfobacillus acidophilus]
MMVLASGHRGIDQFWRDTQPANVVSVRSWDEVLAQWNQASRILIGQHVMGFEAALDWLEQHRDRLSGRQVVLWVEPDFTHAILDQGLPQLLVWRGEIDAQRLQEWWNPTQIGPEPDIGRLCIVVSVFPYSPVAPLIDHLTWWADQHFGAEGGWIDFDWQTAQLSLSWLPEVYRKSDYSFSQLRVKMVKGHRLVLAPPPWYPGESVPDAAMLHRLLQLNWSWQAWFVGAQMSTAWSVELLRYISDVIIWATNNTPLSVIERSEEFLRVYRPDLRLWLCSPDGLTAVQRHARSTWRFWQLTEQQSPVKGQFEPLRRRTFKIPRIWRE